MVFGIFAAHRSADEELMVEARTELVANYRSFLRDQSRREEVVRLAAGKIGLTPDRMDQYFLSEVSNLLDEESVEGLSKVPSRRLRHGAERGFRLHSLRCTVVE